MKSSILACALVVSLLSGCASSSRTQGPVILDFIGPPRLDRIIPTEKGKLVVYSDWADDHQSIEQSFIRHHSDYWILREDGSLLERVRNDPSSIFDEPATVSLPAGNYLVDTTDSILGKVRIPVQIAANRVTTVCLTGEFDDYFRKLALPPDALVTLADGRVVGWSLK